MYEDYVRLRDAKGVRDADVAKATKIHPSTFSDWKKGKSKPKADKLQLIADYFDVPIEELNPSTKRLNIVFRKQDTSKLKTTDLFAGSDGFKKMVEDIMNDSSTPQAKKELVGMAIKLTEEQAEAFLPLLRNLLDKQ